ncbi:hypothetical protein AB8841_21340 [Microvirga sp. TS319]
MTVLATMLGIAATSAARADCESDLVQLEQAYKTRALTPTGKAALDEAKTKGVAALKKDDDAGCHKAVSDAMTKAGLAVK